ncbi:hypothetical protein NHX12_001650 [Muraenolepis orangiensis]|uniref:Protein FAM171A1 n=1 Tax=Muraenolepis orangiensis TaxID=630683 RepID=A0A9Q0IID1_9TELE|nr:hypothetical protein NHX12_001650 [Muraenolepis orangiensis]
MMRVVELSRTTVTVLCLVGYLVSTVVTKTLQEDNGAEEVTLKVHLSDASTRQPLGGATVVLFINHTSVAVETTAAEGNAYLRFPYRLGTLLVVTATKQGYVPRSAPWTPSTLPVFSSLSLELLPERTATLMVYHDVIQIVSGFQGPRARPLVHFQRRALTLPPNVSYANLTALLTVASSPAQLQHFPHLLGLGLGANATEMEKKFELTPVAAISVHLLASDGVELQVHEPINISVPLPADCGLKENDHIPAWRFDPRLGVWLKSSLGYVQREGQQLTLTYLAPQLGYWVAAMSPQHSGLLVAKDISTYHTVFLLAILGGMALILLRRCGKLRGSHRMLTLSSALDSSSSKRDQATSMSHLNLLSSEVQLELVSTATDADMTTPMLKPSSYEQRDNHHQQQHDFISQGKHSRSSLTNNSRQGSSLGNLTPRSRDYRRSVDTFPLKAALCAGADLGYRQSYTSVSSANRISDGLSSLSAHQVKGSAGQMSSSGDGACLSPSCPPHTPSRGDAVEGRPPDYLLSRSVDHLERPVPQLLSRPGQLLCCGSLDILSGGEGYPRVRPTLVIPAHYMRLPGEHPLCGQALLLQTDQQSDLEDLQAELNASHSQQQPLGQANGGCGPGSARQGEREGHGLSESLSNPTSLGETGGLVEINSEDTLLAEKTLMALRGGKPLPHPRAWFVSLEGDSNAHIRHSYIDLQRAGCQGSTPGTGPRQGERGVRGGGGAGGGRRRNANYTSLDSGVDLNEPRVGRKGREEEKEDIGERNKDTPKSTPPAMTTYTKLVYVDDLDRGSSEGESPQSSPQDSTAGDLRSDEAPGHAETLEVAPVMVRSESPSPASSSSSVSPPPLPTPEGETLRDLLPSSPDDDGEDEKKSPWQKREERPLLSFNMK